MQITPTLVIRTFHIVTGLLSGSYFFIAALNNILYPVDNYSLVESILSMRNDLVNSSLQHRTITIPSIHKATFSTIVFLEFLISCIFFSGSYILFKNRNASDTHYHSKKGLLIVAHGLSYFFWFFLFTVVAGEWFYMWKTINIVKNLGFACASLLGVIILIL